MQIAIPLFARFTALDAVGPYEVLSRLPDADVVFVGERRGEYRTDIGSLAITTDATLDEVPAPDIVVVPGGPGTRAPAKAGTADAVVAWIAAAHTTSTWTTSVCTGSLLLGAAGVLDGLPATTHWRAMDLLERFGARATAERVVREGKVITAAGVSSGIDMALTLAALVAGETVARAIQLGIEYDPKPPFDSGAVARATPEVLEAVTNALR